MTDELATEYADTMVGSIADIMARYDGSGHDDDCERVAAECTCENTGALEVHDDDCPVPAGELEGECECSERASDELLESYALELVAERGEPYSALLTFGGPTARVEWSGRMGPNSAVLLVSWWSPVVTRSSPAIRALAEFYSEVMGADEESDR